ncbi:MAG: NAD(P)/FAD-dependent oxidoreductase [Thalassobaculaceae bacterium]
MVPDLFVIGAGPAGMTAAALAAEKGAQVIVLDDQAGPGGQIYRGVEGIDGGQETILGEDAIIGRDIARRFRASGARYRRGSTVWQVTDDLEIAFSGPDGAHLVKADNIILATGAIERPFPVPGWTLPGVMTVGAAQTLLKASALAAEGAVFVGTGPLVYLVAAQYARAGVSVVAVLDTTDAKPMIRAGRRLPAALLRADLLLKGRRWIREVRATGTPVIRNVTDIQIEGDAAANRISYETADGRRADLVSEHIFLHQGVVPNVNLSMSIGLAHSWHAAQACWRPDTDPWGASSVDGVFVAGDGAGIDGAVSAAAAGALSALQVLTRLGRISPGERDRLARRPRGVRRREARVRPFLDAWFRPADRFRVPSAAATMVCRCEEIRLGEISQTIKMGLADPNQLKSSSRAGMGMCQGRFCGLTVQELIARESGRPASEVGYYRLRPPIKPVRVEDMTDLRIEVPDS